MGTFGVDLNFDYGNLKLGKLFEDANKSGAANLSSNQSSINSNFNANIASNYGGSNSSSVETLDLSSSVENKNNNVNINPNNTTSNSTITSNQMNDSSTVNINAGKMNESSQNSTLGNSNVSTNSQNSGGINLNTSNSGTNTSSNMNNSNSYGINNGNDSATRDNGINLNSGKLNGTSNENNSNNIEVSQESNNTSSSSSMNNSNLSKNGTNSNRGAVEQQDNSVDVSINMDTQESSDSGSSFNIKEGKVIITTIDQSGNPIDVEIDVEDYINNLKLFGFNENDINRIINGEISPEKLIEEIQNDSNNTRRRQMMESSYLQAYGLNFTSMEELNNAIIENASKLKELMQSRNEVDNRELDATMKVISRLKMGESLENILKSEIVAWKYVDENGNVCYRYDDPYITGNYDGISYEPLYYKDVYGNSDSFKELKNVLVEETINPLFGDDYTIHRWQETEEQSLYFDKIAKEYSDNIEKRESKLEEIDEQISQLQEQQANYQYIYEYINSEVNYYLKNIDAYTSKNDFLENIYFNNSCVESLNSIKDKYNNSYNYDMYGTGVNTIYVNKSELVNVIACMINGEGNINEGYLSIGNSIYQLSSTDDMLAHYVKWLPFINQAEIEVFNYIYNTEGEDSAYQYLEDISDELDNRWLANKTKEDQEFASEHPFLASVASIVVTPFEGISAACYSLNSYFTGEKIRRADVYSAGDVWRGQVSEDIAENYGEGWAFVYNTGMSMADTGTLIALSLATGGTATPVLSATLMGSRAYVSTLNDALDRGLSDGAAIGLAFSSAVIESAMESYSVGHLLNLETALGGSTSKLVSKVAESIADPTLASIATKTTYIAASALSQGLCEGEEEFATEILNYVADNLISGELSNHSITINNYISLGYSEDEARQLANEDFASQLQQAFLGGFVSGVCFGTFGGVKTTNSVSKDIANNITIDYEGTKAQLFASGIEINRLQQLNIEEQQKNENKQKLINLGNQIKSIFTQNTLNSISVEINENTQNIINNLNGVYDLVVSDGTIEKLISKAKGENGKIAGVELFRMLGYDIKPTVVSENEFLDLSNNSEYGVIARGISGPNSEQYAEQLKNGDMYVGGEHAAIKGTGIYTGFGLSVDKISEKYATRAGTTEGGTVVEMVLSLDAKVIDYETIVIEQTEVLDIMSKEFNKYSSSIVDFDTLLGNLDKITNEIDLQKAKFITNFLMDTGYYAALQGYDAIVDKSVNYLTVLNRGKLMVKQDVLSNGLETEELITPNNNDGINIDELLGKIDSKLSELEELEETKSENIENLNEQSINLTDIVDPEIAAFIVGFDNFKERVKEFNNKTDEELPHFEVFRTKIIEYGSVENILNNLDTFTEWEMGRLLDSSSPILTELFNNQNIIDYVKKNISKEVILNNYSLLFPNHPLITSTFLSLTTEEINDLGSWTIFNKFNSFSLDIQKQFIESHTDFFEKEKDSIFYKSLSKDAFLAIFDKVGSYEFLKSKMWNISSLSSEIQIELYNKYKSTIYNGTQKDFIEFAGNLNDGDYQTDFIKSSPFYSEIINSTKFETLFSKIKSKEFALELIKDSDARIKIENSPDAFKNLVSLLTAEEQYKFKEIAKEKILDINNTSDTSLMIWGSDKVYSYISGFNEVIQNELLNDLDIINSMSIQTMIKLNEKFKGVYLEQMKNMINGNFNAESAKLLFEPSIFQLMNQDTINRAALALKCYEYDKLAKLGNAEAINVVIDKIVANNFNEISNYYSNGLISLYEATDELGKQKIADNISFSVLVSTISSYKGEQFTDILVNRLSSSDVPTEIKITDLRKISQFKPEAYEKIFPYLSSKQKLVTFNYDIVTKLGLTEEFIDIFRENPSLINYMDTYNKGPLNFLKLLSTNDDIEIFYSNITLKTLFDVGISPEFNIMNLEKVKNILKDGLSSYNFMYFNEFSGLARILDNYSVSEQLEILNTMEAENKYFLLLNGNIKNKETKFEMIKLMMNDPKFRTSISDDNIENFKGFFDNLEVEYIDYILKNADNHFLGFMLTITKRNDLNLKFNEMINENSLILNEFEYSDAELIYGNLSNENKVLLDNKINSMISNIGNEKINILFSEATTAQKSAFLDAYNKGLVTNEKIDLLAKIKSKNKFVLSTFNYSLFDETIYQFGEGLLTKLSKYYDVVDQIVELKNNPQKFKLFAQFVINDNTSSSAIVADQKMAMLLNYLLENDIDPVLLSVSNLTELEVARNIILKQIDQFSILDGTMQEIVRDRRIIVPDNYALDNYDLKLGEKCDFLLKEATTVDDVQNLIFNKYFSISIEDATELFRMYGSRFSEIKNLDSTGVATTYLENMQNILNITTMEEATDIYNSFTGINRYNMNETLNIINSIKQIYTKSLKNTLFNPTEVTGYVEYDGKKIPIYEPKGDFQMLIQSTYTNYGGMPMINDNYFDSWNLSSRTANHGICCSLISNNNMGMAMVRGPGVVIGFNSFSDEQMNMMAPYDIYTRNDGYVIKCQRPLLYLPGQDVMNETRHTHNEFNLERTNLTGEGELANIQPDYVVVFEEMSEEQKQNAYKASVDFNVPLVYINKTSLAASESAKIDNLISEYKSSGNIELLKEILVLHENNRSGYRNPTDSSLVTQYFSSERISNVLSNAILQSNAEELIYIKEFLEDELRKFDTTLEATHRANEIDIDAKGLIELIDRRQKILQDLEKTRNLEFNTNIDTNDPDVTAKTISIGNLLRLVTDENYFINFELNNFDFSDFSKEEYNVGIVQLVHAIKKNNYDLGLNETENKRLDYLYNKALEALPSNKIEYNEFLPNDFKLRLMFENNTIYSEKDLFILYDYYLEKFSPEILYNNPILIYSSEFKFYLNVLGNYISINSNQLSNLDVDFWNHLVTAKKDCENIIIEDKIDIGEQDFKNLVSNIYNWHQNEREYVDYFSNYYDVDVSNMNYDQSLPNSLKLKIMIRNNIIYDRSLVINEFNKIITKESINDYNLIFNDLFMFYFKNISANLTPEEVNKTYSFENCNNIYLNNLNKIIIGNIDISEEQFRKLLSMIKIQGPKIENYINNYLENHKEINLSGALDSIQYNDKLPINLKNKIITQIFSEYDWFILQNSSDVYGSDQNAVSKYIQIEGNNLNWLTDESDFINYLVTKREYDQNNANKLLQDLKSTNGVFTINDARTGSILIEYIFDKCARENRFDVLDIFNQSFRFKYNSEIQRLGNKLMNKGMSYVEALRTLCAIDSTGCCSYASIVNSILLSYKNNPQAFENDFGYPLYVYIDGKQEFNAAELLLDMYIYLNSNKFSDNYYHYKGKMFNYDQNGLLHIDELNTNNQVYLSGYTWQNVPAINSFLASKKSSLSYKIEGGDVYGEGHTPSTRENVAKMKEEIINYLKQSANNSVGLGLRRTEKKNLFVKKVIPFRFMTKPGEVYVTTETWNEGGGHAVCITGVLDDYFVVSSWGKRLLIPIEDFTNNNFNVIFRNMEGIK